VVSCGFWLDTDVAIVDPATRKRCDPGQVGEVWLAGSSVTAGYWNRPAENAALFRARLAGEEQVENGFLRTGDLGFIVENELYITGRGKDLMIIHGRNLYPQDIERTVEAGVPAVRHNGCAAFSVTVEDTEQLVVLAELERCSTLDPGQVEDLIRQLVSREHHVAVFRVECVRAGRIPRTTSGKLQRQRARREFLASMNSEGAGSDH
jgi:acyl-CoA synthetase (AMP-forming)/AMP-acid ligase II